MAWHRYLMQYSPKLSDDTASCRSWTFSTLGLYAGNVFRLIHWNIQQNHYKSVKVYWSWNILWKNCMQISAIKRQHCYNQKIVRVGEYLLCGHSGFSERPFLALFRTVKTTNNDLNSLALMISVVSANKGLWSLSMVLAIEWMTL